MAKKKVTTEKRAKIYSKEYTGYVDEMPAEIKAKIEAKWQTLKQY